MQICQFFSVTGERKGVPRTNAPLLQRTSKVAAAQCQTVSRKSTIPHEECGWGAHLPYLGLEPVGG